MKRMIIFIAAMSICAAAYAQDIKTWNEGPLEWSDFTISDKRGGTTSFSLINFSLDNKRVKEGRITYFYKDVHAAFLRNSSWVDEHYISDSELRLNQGLFDLMEIQARKYRDSLLFFDGKIQSLQKYFINTATKEIEECRNEKKLPPYEILDDNFDITKVKWQDSPKGSGVFAGLLVTVPAGALGELVTAAPGASLNETWYSGKNMLTAELNYSIGKARFMYYDTEGIKLGFEKPGKNVPIINLNLLAGHFIYQDDYFKLFLVAGPGYTQVKLYSFTPRGLTITEGIGADIKIHDWVHFSDHVSHNEGVIRVKLSSGQILMPEDNCIIPMMNLSVCVGLPDWKIIRK